MSRWLLLAGLFLAGCGRDSLQGSLADLIPLDFDRATLQGDADALKVSYLRTTGGAPDITFELVVLVGDLDRAGPLDVDLASRLPSGQPRCSASRVERDEVVLFPPVRSGRLTLARPSPAGANEVVGSIGPGTDPDQATGSFGLHFVTEASSRTVGAGRSVHGTFSGVLRAAPPPSLPAP